MSRLVTILLLLIGTTCYSQSDEIYRLTFSDTSNFRLTTCLRHNRPAIFFIADTTDRWVTSRFWLDGLNESSAEVMRRIENDEHHLYNHTYLFRDTTLDKLISDSEKRSLKQKAGLLQSKSIALKGKNFRTVSSTKKLTGFYFVTTEPVFTSDRKYAFIDLTVFYKENKKQELNDTYFGKICVVYEKQNDNRWKKIYVRDHLIL
jgi:hypothetical protein